MGTTMDRELHLLVLEDDALLGHLWRCAGPRVGIRVSVVADATAALERVAAGGVDGLVTDFHLARGTSAALVEQLCRERPELPVLVVTGAPAAARAALGDLVPILQKPVDVEAALAALGLSPGGEPPP